MIVEVGQATRVWLGGEVAEAAYPDDRTLSAELPAGLPAAPGTALRMTVELRRGLGGLVMRALVGAEFVAGAGPARIEVAVARAPFDNGDAASCPSHLGAPLIPGLPADFAPSVLGGLTADADDDPLPGGRLRVDRAAYDLMGSSEAAFFQAARLLRAAVAAGAAGEAATTETAGTDVRARVSLRLNAMSTDRAS